MAQKTETQVLSYKLSDFLKYKEDSNNIPPPLDLIPYFFNGKVFEKPNIRLYLDQMEAVNSAITGSDMDKTKAFIRMVKFCINTMNKKNYDKCIEQLSALDYTAESNVQILIQELILCGMRCPIAIKGLSREKNDNVKSISELCADTITHFSTTIPTFQDELLKICRKFFTDFVNLTKSMDENNESTVDNYKGFMALLGLMYTNSLVPTKVIMECIDSIKRTIFHTALDTPGTQLPEHVLEQTRPHSEKMFGYKKKYDLELYNSIIYHDTQITLDSLITRRKLIECTNYYKGYEHLMNNVISTLELKSSTHSVTEYLISLVQSHQEFISLNKKFKVQNKTQLVNPLKPHVIILHNELGEKLNHLSASLNDDDTIPQYIPESITRT